MVQDCAPGAGSHGVGGWYTAPKVQTLIACLSAGILLQFQKQGRYMTIKVPLLRRIIDEGIDVFEPLHLKSDAARKGLIAAAFPYLAFRCLRKGDDEQTSKEILDYTEMFITSYCSIDCKWCSASIPYYKKKYHIPTDFLLRQLDRYLSVIDGVEVFRVLGGEPFLHPDLAKILTPLIESPKVGSVRIVTNGTVVPKDSELLELLRSEKVALDISNYGEVSCKVPELVAMEERGMVHLNIDRVTTWFVPNHDYRCKNLSPEQALSKYRHCPDYCHVLRDGKLFYCGEAFHIANIPDSPMRSGVDFVDLFDRDKSLEELRAEVNDLIFKRSKRMIACDYCVGSFVHKDRCLIAGEQLAPGEEAPFELPLDIPLVSERMI